MTSEDSDRQVETADQEHPHPFDGLLQVVRELEGLKRLKDFVPDDLLWDRPPGLPSGAELLWLVHLVDVHVFTPSAVATASVNTPADGPDYAGLLAAYPCSHDTLDDLVAEIRASREQLLATLKEEAAKRTGIGVDQLIDTVLTHDRRVLSAFTERLYESGLGG